MYARIASIRSSASATGASSPAVSRLARYWSGMRSERTSGIRSSSRSISPFSAADWIGLSGGMYQTMGRVRYSGCSGKATFQSTAIFQTGESLAASIQLSGTPSRRAWIWISGSLGSRNRPSWASYRSCSFGTLAASSIRSASYSSTPR